MDNIIIQSCDGERFSVKMKIIKEWKFFEDILIKLDNNEVTLKIESSILKLVVLYCNFHLDDPPSATHPIIPSLKRPIIPWDLSFVRMIPEQQLKLLALAAYQLGVTNLLDLCCKSLAKLMQKKTFEEIESMLLIANDK